MQIRPKVLSADHISIHHSPLRDSRSVLCKDHRCPFHHPISKCLLLDLHLTATLISLGIPISNRDKERVALVPRRYPSLKSVRVVVQDAL